MPGSLWSTIPFTAANDPMGLLLSVSSEFCRWENRNREIWEGDKGWMAELGFKSRLNDSKWYFKKYTTVHTNPNPFDTSFFFFSPCTCGQGSNLSHSCDLQHSLQQRQILNSLYHSGNSWHISKTFTVHSIPYRLPFSTGSPCDNWNVLVVLLYTEETKFSLALIITWFSLALPRYYTASRPHFLAAPLYTSPDSLPLDACSIASFWQPSPWQPCL